MALQQLHAREILTLFASRRHDMNRPLSSILVLVSAFVVVSCVRDDGSPPQVDDDDTVGTAMATGTTAVATAGTEVASSSGEFVPVCLPGEVRCDGNTVLRCEPTGLGYSEEECTGNRTCCEGTDSCPEARCISPCEADNFLPSSAGCSFIANRQLHVVDGLLEYHGLEDEREEPDAVIVANPNTELVATIQAYFIPEGQAHEEPFGDPLTLAPGEFDLYTLNSAFVQGETTMLRSGGMYRIDSDAPIIAYQHAPYRAFVGNDSSMLLPDNTLGNDYVVASYSPHHEQNEGLGRPTYFEIIAIEDNTDVEWLAQRAATAGNGLPVDPVPRGEWSEVINMNRYDTMRVTASVTDYEDNPDFQDVSGTVIHSSKPIWVIGASRCSRVPVRDEPALGFCDPLQELMIPMQYWGSEYVVPRPPPRDTERHYWRIFGAEGGITVQSDETVDGLPYTFESRGDYIEVSAPRDVNFVLTGDGPFMPVGYLQSRFKTGEAEDELQTECTADDECTTKGDPAMYQLIPTGQFLNRYVFATGVEWTEHYVQIVRTRGGAEIRIDGGPLTATFFEVGDFEVADERILEGTHTLESDDPFGIVQFGYAFTPLSGCDEPLGVTCNSSYAYPGGMKSDPDYVP